MGTSERALRSCLVVIASLLPIGVNGIEVPITCDLDYHVLAYYSDSAKAIETEIKTAEFKYATGTPFYGSETLFGKQFAFYSGCLIATGHEGKAKPSLYFAFKDPKNQGCYTASIPLSSSRDINFSYALENQPPVLPEETNRNYFWSLRCKAATLALETECQPNGQNPIYESEVKVNACGLAH